VDRKPLDYPGAIPAIGGVKGRAPHPGRRPSGRDLHRAGAMKRKLDKISGHDPWEIEVAALAEHLKLKPDDARDIVAIRWMHRGDLRPLAALPGLDGVVFSELRKMINAGELTVTRKRGAPRQPSKSIRDIFIAARYETRTGKSADAIQALAKEFNISDELVRRAIKRRPRRPK